MADCKARLLRPSDERQPFSTPTALDSDMYSSSLQFVSLVPIMACLHFGMKAKAHQVDTPSTADVTFGDGC